MEELSRRGFLQAGGALAALGAVPAIAAEATAAPPPRQVQPLDSGWRFHLGHAADPARDFGFGSSHDTYAKSGDIGSPIQAADYDDSAWQAVELPHDWAVDLPFTPFGAPGSEADKIGAYQGFKPLGRRFPATSVGWYRRELPIAASEAGRRLFLDFDGVGRDCLVILNGFVVGSNESGYVPFRLDITDFAKPGERNILLVRCDVSLGEAWSYEGAGLYRQVRLVSCAPAYIRHWGTAVRCTVEGESTGDAATIAITTELDNDGPALAIRLRSTLLDPQGKAVTVLLSDPVTLADWTGHELTQTVRLEKPSLWSLEQPSLYRLVSEVLTGEQVIDRVETPFGIRSFRFDANHGLFLNGKPVKVKGTCNHQDHAGVGFAVPDSLHVWRVEQLKAMGSNAYRSTHHPAPPAVLEACDRLGMLVLEETRQMSSNPEGLGQLERMVRRGRNHPSIFLWSIGNEEIHRGTETGARIAETMKRRVYALDGTRPVTEAFNGKLGQGASRVLDVMGCNYYLDEIDAFHAAHPTVPMIGTETASTVMMRGAYHRDDQAGILPAYDREFPRWASTAERWWRFYDERPFLAGGFVWTGFDYRGEPTPFERWPQHTSYFGIMDSCGLPKDNYYYYRAWWQDSPVLHLFPHWNWPGREGQPVEVWVHANCHAVELLVNGSSLGRQRVERNGHLQWMVPYVPGWIEVLGFDATGRQILTQRRETTGKPAAIALSSDRQRLAGGEVAVIRAAILDQAGREVPMADNLVRFRLAGAARLLGVGNGDPRSLEPDHADQRHAFNGLCTAILQAKGRGPIRVEAESVGLKTGILEL